MVCHETYKDPDNNWIAPEDIEIVEGKKYFKKDKSKIITVGPSESMSKSKKNTIDPENIISNYGADAARLFILSDSPPEKDVQWSDEGINSSHKFIQKLWQLNQKIMEEMSKEHKNDSSNKLTKYTNQFIKKMTHNLETFSYNILIANLHEMNNFFNKEISSKYTKKTIFENYSKILITMMPIIPHFASECISINKFNIDTAWPSYDSSMLIEENVNIVVQINGKKRALINCKRDISEENLFKEIKNDIKINKYFSKDNFLKSIFIKNKLINIIVKK